MELEQLAGQAQHLAQVAPSNQSCLLRLLGLPSSQPSLTCRDVRFAGGTRRRQVPQRVVCIHRLNVRQRAAHLQRGGGSRELPCVWMGKLAVQIRGCGLAGLPG